MPEPSIRPATPDDLAALLVLYRHLHPNDPQPDPAAAAHAWSTLLSSGLVVPIVASLAGTLVASCTLAVIPNLTRGARSFGVIENVVTHPRHRRTGLGRAVLQAAIQHAWRANCYKVTLATGSRQEATLAFYQAAGFQKGGKTYFEIRSP